MYKEREPVAMSISPFQSFFGSAKRGSILAEEFFLRFRIVSSVPFHHNKIEKGSKKWQENNYKYPNKPGSPSIVVLEHMK